MPLQSYFPYSCRRLPYLTDNIDPTGGEIKNRESDFKVEEIPLYEPNGFGPHLYFEVRKRGISTPKAVRLLANHLDIKPSAVGVPGNKDAKAVTCQRMSVEHIEPEDLAGINREELDIQPLDYHRNKLRPGHLQANKFDIKIRNVNSAAKDSARSAAEILKEKGIPNYYTSQRFGRRGDSAILGECLLKDRLEDFVEYYLGKPVADDPPDIKKAREYFARDDYEKPFDYWPYSCQNRRNCLAAYKNTKKPPVVVGEVPKRMRRLFVSAFQSQVFNAVLARRIENIDRLLSGDVAKKHDSGGIFNVKDVAAEQARADRFEISPTGPLPGGKMMKTEDKAREIETEVFEKFDLQPEKIKKAGSLRVDGTRRPLRFQADDLKIESGRDDYGPFLNLKFAAPSGSYATALLREITKN